MMSGIKSKRKRNKVDELSEHFQDAKTVISQESNATFCYGHAASKLLSTDRVWPRKH